MTAPSTASRRDGGLWAPSRARSVSLAVAAVAAVLLLIVGGGAMQLVFDTSQFASPTRTAASAVSLADGPNGTVIATVSYATSSGPHNVTLPTTTRPRSDYAQPVEVVYDAADPGHATLADDYDRGGSTPVRILAAAGGIGFLAVLVALVAAVRWLYLEIHRRIDAIPAR